MFSHMNVLFNLWWKECLKLFFETFKVTLKVSDDFKNKQKKCIK